MVPMTTDRPSSVVVPLSLVRRVHRVRDRFSLVPEHLDEVFDDFFVLWRAFESTLDGVGRNAARAEDAVVETLRHARNKAGGTGAHLGQIAPRITHWAHELRLFQRVHDMQLAHWFSEEEITTVQGQEIRKRLARLVSAAKAPERWNDQNSGDAGWTMYRLRSAVFHGTVETSDDIAPRLAPLTCAALIELCALRAAFIARVGVADGWRLVGGPDEHGGHAG